ncbi:MAG: tetratricopeptide repeat protein [Planctomycetota bacterium]
MKNQLYFTATLISASVLIPSQADAQQCQNNARWQPVRNLMRDTNILPALPRQTVPRQTVPRQTYRPTVPPPRVYTTPVQTVYRPSAPAQPPVTKSRPPMSEARNKTQVAKAFFGTRQYAQALPYLDRVIQLRPQDADAFQFRALIHFALGNHEKAAADAYDAFQFGSAWTAPVVAQIYNQNTEYSQHLRRLRQTVASQPTMPGHFLLAYHEFVRGDITAGRSNLRAVLAMQPGEPLSEKLLAATLPKADTIPVSRRETASTDAQAAK